VCVCVFVFTVWRSRESSPLSWRVYRTIGRQGEKPLGNLEAIYKKPYY
jgi:hypothetical protein